MDNTLHDPTYYTSVSDGAEVIGVGVCTFFYKLELHVTVSRYQVRSYVRNRIQTIVWEDVLNKHQESWVYEMKTCLV